MKATTLQLCSWHGCMDIRMEFWSQERFFRMLVLQVRFEALLGLGSHCQDII